MASVFPLLMPSPTRSANIQQHLPLACAQTGVDLNLFAFLNAHADRFYSVEQLAQELGADAALLGIPLAYESTH